MKREKAFTLIELLAVIVILVIVAIIATPMILDVINTSRDKANMSSAYGILDTARLHYVENKFNDTVTPTGDILGSLKVGGDKPSSGEVMVNVSGEIAVALIYDDKCYKKGYNETEIIVSKDATCVISTYTEVVLNGADPVLKDSMIPIYFDGNVAKKANTKTDWYSYADKKWANVVLVKETGTKTRQAYIDADAGTIIDEGDLLVYLVWIPRYKYKLFNVEQTANTTPSQIEIVFESRTTPKSNGTTNGSYLTAPGFTFGTEEASGIWMGKFETTGDITTPTIKPNVTSLRSQNVSSFFNINQKFNNNATYGLTSGTRMARNTDWSVAAYLSRSVYGINEEVRINNNNGFITGCGASTGDANAVGTCDIAYGQALNEVYHQSTTGNITGIFDMSGGAWEYVLGVLADPSGNPRSGQDSGWNSGYNGMLGNGSMKTDGLAFPESKYYDLYTASDSNLCTGGKCLGHSFGEIAGWYGDAAYYAYPSYPWVVRGGGYNDTSGAGAFYFNNDGGYAYSLFGSRAVISVIK